MSIDDLIADVSTAAQLKVFRQSDLVDDFVHDLFHFNAWTFRALRSWSVQRNALFRHHQLHLP